MKLLDRQRSDISREIRDLPAGSRPDLWSLFTRKLTFKVPRPPACNPPDIRQDLLDEAAVEEMPQLCVVHECDSVTTAQGVKKKKTRRGKRGGK
ncbi:hypothetical protein FRC09_014119 [Ceratobasidium sp. 395]|nr:hypothetical protein FRC09_014119 [Ceratobasidium sp. 395]